jgi:cytochrome c-type biogenesis protein
MVPIYLGILGANSQPDTNRSKVPLILSGLLFILGFTLIFITLGFSATLIGSLIYPIKPWIARIGGLFVLIYGIHLTGWIRWKIFDLEWKPMQKLTSKNNYLNALLMGIFFSAGWSPCIGPILGGILTALASSQTTTYQGMLYLLFYSLGIGLPFLLAAAGLQPFIFRLQRKPIIIRRIQQVSGILLAIFGVLLMLGLLSRLAQFSPKWLL